MSDTNVRRALPNPYDASYPPDAMTPPPPNATGATAGVPGTWTPSGCVVPVSLAQTIAWSVVASPATAWTSGQSVVTNGGGPIHWSGTAWVAGAAAVTNANTKAEIVSWLLSHGVTLDESALNELTKAELLVLVADLLDDEVP